MLLLLLLTGFFMGRFPSPMGNWGFVLSAFHRSGYCPDVASLTFSHPLGSGGVRICRCIAIFYQMLVWAEPWRCIPRCWVGALVGHGSAGRGIGVVAGFVAGGSALGMEFRAYHTGFYRRLGMLLVGLAFRNNPTATLSGWWQWLVGAMTFGALGGSLVIIGHWLKSDPKTQGHCPVGCGRP